MSRHQYFFTGMFFIHFIFRFRMKSYSYPNSAIPMVYGILYHSSAFRFLHHLLLKQFFQGRAHIQKLGNRDNIIKIHIDTFLYHCSDIIC